MSKAISIENLSLYYGESKALKEVTLDIEANKSTAFIGPSGCGKSTLLRCLNRLNDLIEGVKIEGEIKISGTNIYDPCIKDKSKLDHVIEKSLKGAALWDEVKDRLNESAYSLSGGQQQRLCIARAIAVEPTILLMDEPCSALDPIATAKVEELIKELKKDYTIVIVTHNMQQASRVSDYTAFMFLGELIEFDETKTIFMNPSIQQTNDYISGRFG